MNAINSPTATNLARGTIIELAQNVYNNALAAKEQADRAAGVIAEGVNEAAEEADRAGVARLAAEAAATAADGAATAADGAWNAATDEADRAKSEADRAQGLVDGEIARAAAEADRAEAEADRAEAAADRAENATPTGGGGVVTIQSTAFPDGYIIAHNPDWNDNDIIVISFVSSALPDAKMTYCSFSVGFLRSIIASGVTVSLTPWVVTEYNVGVNFVPDTGLVCYSGSNPVFAYRVMG